MTGSRRLGAGTRESVLQPGPRLVTELDEGPGPKRISGREGVERGGRMTFVGFLGVLVLVLSLLISVGSLAFAPDGWGPEFHRLWGAIIVALGIGFVAFEKLVKQMGVRGQAEAPVSSEFECFGVAFAVSGTAYGLTGEVWVFITCILISGIVLEFGPQSRSDDVPPSAGGNDARDSWLEGS